MGFIRKEIRTIEEKKKRYQLTDDTRLITSYTSYLLRGYQ